jgi:hypothetical protein
MIVVQALCIVFRILWYPVFNYSVLKIRHISLVKYGKQYHNTKLFTVVWYRVRFPTDIGLCLFTSLYGLPPERHLLSGGYHEQFSRITAARA